MVDLLNKQEWDEIWKSRDVWDFDVQKTVSSNRFKYIKSIISREHNFSGLNVIEIGSGTGKESLALALLGANITLMDYSTSALEKAEKIFASENIKPKLIHCDALDIPQNLFNNFDLCMSFGLAEHFIGKERHQIIEAHSLLSKII